MAKKKAKVVEPPRPEPSKPETPQRRPDRKDAIPITVFVTKDFYVNFWKPVVASRTPIGGKENGSQVFRDLVAEARKKI